MRIASIAFSALFLVLMTPLIFAKNEHMLEPAPYRMTHSERPDIAQALCVSSHDFFASDGAAVRLAFQEQICADSGSNLVYVLHPFGDQKTVAGYLWSVNRVRFVSFADGPIYTIKVAGTFWGIRILSMEPGESRIALDIYPDGSSGERVSREFSVPHALPLQSETQQ